MQLADSTKSDDILDNIQAASDLLQRGESLNTGVEVKALLTIKLITNQERNGKLASTSLERNQGETLDS